MSKLSYQVGVRRLELPASSSRTTRAANCATPRVVVSALPFSSLKGSARYETAANLTN
jgi:hypothetical protein